VLRQASMRGPLAGPLGYLQSEAAEFVSPGARVSRARRETGGRASLVEKAAGEKAPKGPSTNSRQFAAVDGAFLGAPGSGAGLSQVPRQRLGRRPRARA